MDNPHNTSYSSYYNHGNNGYYSRDGNFPPNSFSQNGNNGNNGANVNNHNSNNNNHHHHHLAPTVPISRSSSATYYNEPEYNHAAKPFSPSWDRQDYYYDSVRYPKTHSPDDYYPEYPYYNNNKRADYPPASSYPESSRKYDYNYPPSSSNYRQTPDRYYDPAPATNYSDPFPNPDQTGYSDGYYRSNYFQEGAPPDLPYDSRFDVSNRYNTNQGYEGDRRWPSSKLDSARVDRWSKFEEYATPSTFKTFAPNVSGSLVESPKKKSFYWKPRESKFSPTSSFKSGKPKPATSNIVQNESKETNQTPNNTSLVTSQPLKEDNISHEIPEQEVEQIQEEKKPEKIKDPNIELLVRNCLQMLDYKMNLALLPLNLSLLTLKVHLPPVESAVEVTKAEPKEAVVANQLQSLESKIEENSTVSQKRNLELDSVDQEKKKLKPNSMEQKQANTPVARNNQNGKLPASATSIHPQQKASNAIDIAVQLDTEESENSKSIVTTTNMTKSLLSTTTPHVQRHSQPSVTRGPSTPTNISAAQPVAQKSNQTLLNENSSVAPTNPTPNQTSFNAPSSTATPTPTKKLNPNGSASLTTPTAAPNQKSVLASSIKSSSLTSPNSIQKSNQPAVNGSLSSTTNLPPAQKAINKTVGGSSGLTSSGPVKSTPPGTNGVSSSSNASTAVPPSIAKPIQPVRTSSSASAATVTPGSTLIQKKAVTPFPSQQQAYQQDIKKEPPVVKPKTPLSNTPVANPQGVVGPSALPTFSAGYIEMDKRRNSADWYSRDEWDRGNVEYRNERRYDGNQVISPPNHPPGKYPEPDLRRSASAEWRDDRYRYDPNHLTANGGGYHPKYDSKFDYGTRYEESHGRRSFDDQLYYPPEYSSIPPPSTQPLPLDHYGGRGWEAVDRPWVEAERGKPPYDYPNRNAAYPPAPPPGGGGSAPSSHPRRENDYYYDPKYYDRKNYY